MWPGIRLQVFHWLGTLIVFKVIFMLQWKGFVSRESAADMAIVVLALSCWQAGVHFDWSFLLLAIVLIVMEVALAYFEKVGVWLVTVPVAIALAWLYFKRKLKGTTKVAA